MPLEKHNAEKIAITLQKVNPFFSIDIDPHTNNVTALAKTCPLDFEQLIELAHIAKENTLWLKRAGSNIGFFISKR